MRPFRRWDQFKKLPGISQTWVMIFRYFAICTWYYSGVITFWYQTIKLNIQSLTDLQIVKTGILYVYICVLLLPHRIVLVYDSDFIFVVCFIYVLIFSLLYINSLVYMYYTRVYKVQRWCVLIHFLSSFKTCILIFTCYNCPFSVWFASLY